jgi:hypothetical protein
MAVVVMLHVLIDLVLVVRVLLRPHRESASRIAWVVVIVAPGRPGEGGRVAHDTPPLE